jgi:hypothetical protein
MRSDPPEPVHTASSLSCGSHSSDARQDEKGYRRLPGAWNRSSLTETRLPSTHKRISAPLNIFHGLSTLAARYNRNRELMIEF